MSQLVTLQTASVPDAHGVSAAIGILVIDHPPVNAISAATVQGLIAAWAEFERREELRALVIHCAGRTFVAGGDIAAFEDPAFSAQPYNNFLARLEASHRPVIAALHGTALGGGLEFAMACHWRVAVQGTRVGLPEIKLGLIPGSLGTQRLPRLAGARLALELMQSGRMVGTTEALHAGIIDEICASDPLQAALQRATQLISSGAAPRRASALRVDPATLPENFPEQTRALARLQAQYPAQEAVVDCVHAACTLPFEQGEEVEAQWFAKVLRSRTSKAMRHLFFAERAAEKIPGLPKDLKLRDIRKVGVLGAGTMGGGIAMSFVNAGYDTVLVEANAEALERGLSVIRGNYDATVAKGRLSAEERDLRLGRLSTSLDDSRLATCDIVIEAVFENMALKQQIAQRLGAICKPGAIIATNTSTLDVDAIAAASGRPGDVLGTHFFSPANVMRLLEVVRGKGTAPDALATVMQLARRINKVAVVSGVCYGFIGNRMAEVYMREAEFLLLEGATPRQIDRAIEGLGLAMGPCRMLDMAGIDVGAKTVIECEKAGGLPPDPSYRVVVRKLFELGHFGQKTGLGYYRYEGRSALDHPPTTALCETLAHEHGIVRRTEIGDQEIIERLIYSMVNEGARILDEGIAYRGSDIDVVWTSGYGFALFQGGPMFMADELGLGHVVQAIDRLAASRGNAYGYWTVSPLLRRLAAEGGRLSQYAG